MAENAYANANSRKDTENERTNMDEDNNEDNNEENEEKKENKENENKRNTEIRRRDLLSKKSVIIQRKQNYKSFMLQFDSICQSWSDSG